MITTYFRNRGCFEVLARVKHLALLTLIGMMAMPGRAEIVSVEPNLSANNFQRISFRFNVGTGVVTTQLNDMNTPPVYGSLFGQSMDMMGDFFTDYYIGEGYSSPSGYQSTSGAVASGTTINAGSGWTAQASTSSSIAATYYGVRIVYGDGNFTYGWAKVGFGNSGDGSTQLLALAFERTLNQPILAGAMSSVPEPSSCAALAGAGVVACAGMRRRRRAAVGA